MKMTKEIRDYVDTESFDIMDENNNAEILKAIRYQCERYPKNEGLVRMIRLNVIMIRAETLMKNE